jgi:hypothetical protein
MHEVSDPTAADSLLAVCGKDEERLSGGGW